MESSDNIKWQMNCCLCCGAPTDPSRQALSKDGLCCRAMLFIHGEAIRNKSEFNSGEEPHVIGPRQALHLFHRSSFLPVLGSFVGGPAEEVWGGMDTPVTMLETLPVGWGGHILLFFPIHLSLQLQQINTKLE